MSRWVQSVLVFGLVLPLDAGCLDPTQIKVEVTTDMDCSVLSSPETGLTFGDPAVPEGPEQNTTTYECESRVGLDYIGSITAVPRDDDEALVAIRVMTAVGVQLDACDLLQPGSPCIVARRQLHYIPQTTLNVPIVMREACLGVQCLPGQTCRLGECVGALIKSNECPEGNCGEELLQGRSPGTLGDEVRLTEGAGQDVEPSLLWNDGDFALEWIGDSDGPQRAHFMRFDASGVVVVSAINAFDIPGGAKAPVLSSAGEGFAVAFESDGHAHVRSLSQQGLEDGPFTMELLDVSSPTLASVDSVGAVAGIHNIDGLLAFLLRSDEEGDPINVSGAAGSPRQPMLSATTTGFGLAWQESSAGGNPQIFVALLDTDGNVSAPIQITTDSRSSTEPSIAASSTGFGLAWVDDRDGNEEIYFATLDATGARSGPVTRVTDADGSSTDPALVWTGTDFGLAWSDERGDESQIYFTRLDEGGGRMDELPITPAESSATEPTLVWTDTQFGLVWTDRRNDSSDLYFATITPPAPISQPQ